jgi:hypothetical protein
LRCTSTSLYFINYYLITHGGNLHCM